QSNRYAGMENDTTSSSGQYRNLSPFILGKIPTYIQGLEAKNFENLWQFSKVYKEHLDKDGDPNDLWFKWRNWGWTQSRAQRYPMGKGSKPEYAYWDGEKLGYIDARKRIYAPIYAENVIKTDSFRRLKDIYDTGRIIVLRDYDAYDHQKLNLTLIDVINNPGKKMGHAFVLIMILTNMLEACIHS
ncbi:unnamed protein product, partial [marine sediment metagenome]